jgi:hypothetical protein
VGELSELVREGEELCDCSEDGIGEEVEKGRGGGDARRRCLTAELRVDFHDE